MSADDLSLPDDMDLLKAMVRTLAQKATLLEDEDAALKARNSDADERIKRLMQILRPMTGPGSDAARRSLEPAKRQETRMPSSPSSLRRSRPGSLP